MPWKLCQYTRLKSQECCTVSRDFISLYCKFNCAVRLFYKHTIYTGGEVSELYKPGRYISKSEKKMIVLSKIEIVNTLYCDVICSAGYGFTWDNSKTFRKRERIPCAISAIAEACELIRYYCLHKWICTRIHKLKTQACVFCPVRTYWD